MLIIPDTQNISVIQISERLLSIQDTQLVWLLRYYKFYAGHGRYAVLEAMQVVQAPQGMQSTHVKRMNSLNIYRL